MTTLNFHNIVYVSKIPLQSLIEYFLVVLRIYFILIRIRIRIINNSWNLLVFMFFLNQRRIFEKQWSRFFCFDQEIFNNLFFNSFWLIFYPLDLKHCRKVLFFLKPVYPNMRCLIMRCLKSLWCLLTSSTWSAV